MAGNPKDMDVSGRRQDGTSSCRHGSLTAAEPRLPARLTKGALNGPGWQPQHLPGLQRLGLADVGVDSQQRHQGGTSPRGNRAQAVAGDNNVRLAVGGGDSGTGAGAGTRGRCGTGQADKIQVYD